MKNPIHPALLASAILLSGCHTTSITSSAPTPAIVASAPNLTGQWQWTCCKGKYQGELTLQQDAAGKITGRLFDQNDATGGAMVGSINGNTVLLTRIWADDLRQDYTLTLSDDGKKLEGKFDGTQDTEVGTHFEATRK